MHIGGEQDVAIVIDKNAHDGFKLIEQHIKQLELVDEQNG